MNGFHQHLSKSVLYLKNRQGWAVINSKWLDSGRLAEEKRVKICFGITIIYIYIYILLLLLNLYSTTLNREGVCV